jgi:hypothetical protein
LAPAKKQAQAIIDVTIVLVTGSPLMVGWNRRRLWPHQKID